MLSVLVTLSWGARCTQEEWRDAAFGEIRPGYPGIYQNGLVEYIEFGEYLELE